MVAYATLNQFGFLCYQIIEVLKNEANATTFSLARPAVVPKARRGSAELFVDFRDLSTVPVDVLPLNNNPEADATAFRDSLPIAWFVRKDWRVPQALFRRAPQGRKINANPIG